MNTFMYMRKAGLEWLTLWLAVCTAIGFWLWPAFVELIGDAISYDAGMGWFARLGCTAVFAWGSDSGCAWTLLAIITFLGIM